MLLSSSLAVSQSITLAYCIIVPGKAVCCLWCSADATHDTCRTAVLSFVWFLMLQYFLLQAGCQLFFVAMSWSPHSKTTVFQWQQGSHRISLQFCVCACTIVTGCWAALLSDSSSFSVQNPVATETVASGGTCLVHLCERHLVGVWRCTCSSVGVLLVCGLEHRT